MKRFGTFFLLHLCALSCCCYAQDQPEKAADITAFPSKLLSRIQSRASSLDDQLTRQTGKYLQKMARREERLREKLSKADPAAAKTLFEGSQDKYLALSHKLAGDSGDSSMQLSGQYQAYTDSLQGILKFMQGNPAAAGSLRQLQSLEAKMRDAGEIRAYMQERKQAISEYVRQHAQLSGILGVDLHAMNQHIYYYSHQVQEYKEALNDPDKLLKQALVVLNKIPAFQTFMKQNSQLAGLFNLPSNYGSTVTLQGLQTRDQVAALVQQQVSAGGAGGQAALQTNLQSAQSQLDGYKDKLTNLGAGGGDIDMPDFKPNAQKTKTFWKRLEYGTNFQTTRNNYYFPTVSDFGLSVGYKLGDRSTFGVGASYKLGWGNGIRHIAFSSQGVGLRTYMDIRIKGSFSATGGLEFNYTTPFARYQQLSNWDNWTKSGLIGVSKTVSMKSRVFRKTKVQLLWDVLSYQQRPKTQAVVFRINYMW
jgi:hypothetical protein